MPKLTIGTAQHNDFSGVYFPFQSIRLHHAKYLKDIEFVLINNSPQLNGSAELKQFVEGNAAVGCAGTKYIEMAEPVGTSPSRDRIFKEATGDAVLVLDSHVLLVPGAIDKLIEWYNTHPDTKDLYGGPLILDHLNSHVTHFNDNWRAEMWGTWGMAWKCPCDKYKGTVFSMCEANVLEPDGMKVKAAPRLINGLGNRPILKCENCNKPIPLGLDWNGHEAVLYSKGYTDPGKNPTDIPFEIPGQGLGCFSCRREAWLGFHPDAREFGGEELWIHEKFRKAGHKAICLPFLQWVHRFYRPDGPKYPVTRMAKIRNYMLEFAQIGMDNTPIKEHFGMMLADDQWRQVSAGTQKKTWLLGDVPEPEAEKKPCCGQGQPAQPTTLEQLYENAAKNQSDINEHAAKLRELASQAEHVTEFGMRPGVSTVALLAGQPKKLISFNPTSDPVVPTLIEKKGECDFDFKIGNSLDVEIEETDLLFIDTKHTAEHVYAELNKHGEKVRGRIAFHDTNIFGEKGEDGSPGLMTGIRQYLIDHPEWTVIYDVLNNHGFTVISKLKADKPKLPPYKDRAKIFAKAVFKHVEGGFKHVSEEVAQTRLEICMMCPLRTGDNGTQCSRCSCYLPVKVTWAHESCPAAKWVNVDLQDKLIPLERISDDESDSIGSNGSTHKQEPQNAAETT